MPIVSAIEMVEKRDLGKTTIVGAANDVSPNTSARQKFGHRFSPCYRISVEHLVGHTSNDVAKHMTKQNREASHDVWF